MAVGNGGSATGTGWWQHQIDGELRQAAQPRYDIASPEPQHAAMLSRGPRSVTRLVLLCHKLSLAARTSRQPSRQGARESNAEGGDGVGDVAFGTERRRRGVGNPWVGEAL